MRHVRRPTSDDARGFSLMEMLVVVVVIGILAAVALPRYAKTIEREMIARAQDLLLTVYTGERSYFFINNAYLALNAGDLNATWRQIFIDNPSGGSGAPASAGSGVPVDFSVTVDNTATPKTFLVTGTRDGGACPGGTVRVTQDRVQSGTWQGCVDDL